MRVCAWVQVASEDGDAVTVQILQEVDQYHSYMNDVVRESEIFNEAEEQVPPPRNRAAAEAAGRKQQPRNQQGVPRNEQGRSSRREETPSRFNAFRLRCRWRRPPVGHVQARCWLGMAGREG